jgi:hypothetical protein
MPRVAPKAEVDSPAPLNSHETQDEEVSLRAIFGQQCEALRRQVYASTSTTESEQVRQALSERGARRAWCDGSMPHLLSDVWSWLESAGCSPAPAEHPFKLWDDAFKLGVASACVHIALLQRAPPVFSPSQDQARMVPPDSTGTSPGVELEAHLVSTDGRGASEPAAAGSTGCNPGGASTSGGASASHGRHAEPADQAASDLLLPAKTPREHGQSMVELAATPAHAMLHPLRVADPSHVPGAPMKASRQAPGAAELPPEQDRPHVARRLTFETPDSALATPRSTGSMPTPASSPAALPPCPMLSSSPYWPPPVGKPLANCALSSPAVDARASVKTTSAGRSLQCGDCTDAVAFVSDSSGLKGVFHSFKFKHSSSTGHRSATMYCSWLHSSATDVFAHAYTCLMTSATLQEQSPAQPSGADGKPQQPWRVNKDDGQVDEG